MTRTTVDIDAAVLRDLKRLQRREGKPLGQLISEIVAAGLAREQAGTADEQPFEWTARPMKARVDIDDKDALLAALDSS